MTLIPRRPFEDLDRFFEDDDWFLPLVHKGRAVEPALDLYEKDNNLIAELNLPGIDPEKVEVTVKDHTLRITGGSEETKEEEDKDKGYWRKEIRKGSFDRIVQLPTTVDENNIEANYEDGILKVTMPKSEEKADAKRIEVKKK